MRLIDAVKICKQPPPERAQAFRVGLLCGFTPLHLKTFLEAELRVRLPGRHVVVNTGIYGDLLGNLARQEDSEAAVVVIEWPDLDPRLGLRVLGGWKRADIEDISREVPRRLEAIERELERLASRGVPVGVSLPTLPLPPIPETPAWRAGHAEAVLRETVARFAAAINRNVQLHLLSEAHLLLLCPLAERFDVRSEIAAGFPYTLPHAAALAEELARVLAPGAVKKGLITDLDNTLWSGIAGEIGPDAVAWDLDNQALEHGLYQQMLAALGDRGVLLAAASKSEAAPIQSALARSDLRLPRDLLFPIEAHWKPKSESVGRILEAWNISADAVVFVDDSPMELDEVQRAYPAIQCLRFPAGDPGGVWGLIGQLRDLFAKPGVSEEDLLRAASIRRNVDRRREAAGAGVSAEEFLAQAGAVLRYSSNRSDPRALELINKTNQFNLNGRRYTEAEWAAYLRDPEVRLFVIHYADKYGPLGKIAVLSGRQLGETFRGENWVMSCRAFSRRIEHQALAHLVEESGAAQIHFEFVPTARNAPFRSFVAEMTGCLPDGDVVLSRSQFEGRRPALYHHVETDAE